MRAPIPTHIARVGARDGRENQGSCDVARTTEHRVTVVVACSLLTFGMEVLVLPVPAATSPKLSQPLSRPFLLVRPSSRDVTAVKDDDEKAEPSAKSVPPRAPAPAVTTSENQLPSVIVDARAREDELAALESAVQEQCAQLEARRTSDLDGLLRREGAGDGAGSIDDMRRQPTLPSIEREPARARHFARSFAIGLVAALVLGGGALGAVVHLAR
jgi:hypothetical protein